LCNDAIILNPGIYYQNGIIIPEYRARDLLITITSNDAAGGDQTNTIIDGINGQSGIIITDKKLEINGLTLRNGYSSTGGAIKANNQLTVISSTFTNCSAGDGGAIYSRSYGIRVSESTFNDCIASLDEGINYRHGGGGAIFTLGTISIDSSKFFNCHSKTRGGALYSNNYISVANSQFSDCSADIDGGAIDVFGSPVTVTGSSFVNCSAPGWGGAIFSYGGNIHYSRFSNVTDYYNEIIYSHGYMNTAYNWFGSNNPWNGETCDPSEPWMVLGITATPDSISPGETTAINTNITYDCSGVYHDPGIWHIPDGIPITYTTVSNDISVPYGSGNIVYGVSNAAFTLSSADYTLFNATADDQTVNVAFGTPPPTIPTITSISPTYGPTTGGTFVIIKGSHFIGSTAVSFGEKNDSNYFWADNDNVIYAVSPSGSVGTVDIIVTTPEGISATGDSDRFTYKEALNFTVSPEKIRTSDIVTFDASDSIDSDYETIIWDFGDGSYDISGKPVVNHNYSEVGTYTANLIVTDTSGVSNSISKQVNVTIPVVLVHGFWGSPATWTEMRTHLENEGFQVWVFDYEADNMHDPRDLAPQLADYIKKQRNDITFNGQKYNGKIDIVCHSMGALVSRLYMETVASGDDGPQGDKVRQWIGIAPAHQGSAFADRNPDPQIGAIHQLHTDSFSVRLLRIGVRSPETKYRVIAGWNPTRSLDFGQDYNPPFNLSATLAWKPLDPEYYWTYRGDMIVAVTQAYDPSMQFDAFPLWGILKDGQNPVDFDHTHITHTQEVIETVTAYEENIDLASSNYVPPEEEYEIDWDNLTVFQKTYASKPIVIAMKKFIVSAFCPVDISITDPDGLTINKLSNEIAGATYTEIGIGEDGTPDVQIIIPVRKVGDYLITVTPKTGALPNAKYSLTLTQDGESAQMIANNISINEIPKEPYILRVSSDGDITIIGSGLTPAPEFPSLLVPAVGVIGFIGVVFFIRRTREN